MQLAGKLKEMLLKKKKELELELTELNRRAKNSLSNMATNVSNDHPADYSPVQDVSLSLIQGRKKMISKCNEALERLTRGEYGICAHCGCEIPIARLMSVPFTDKCIECKKEIEEEDTLYMNGAKRRISKYYNSNKIFLS